MCISRHAGDRQRWPQAPATVRTNLSKLIPGLQRIAKQLSAEHQELLFRRGLDSLRSEELWAQIEAVSHLDRAGKYLVQALRFFTALHRDDPDLKSPSILLLRGGHSDLSDLYQASAPFMLAYKRLVEAYDAGGETDKSGMLFKHRTYSLLALLVRDASAATLLAREGFGAFAIHSSLVKKVEAVRTWQSATTLVDLLNRFDSERWQTPTASVYGHVADLTELCSYSQAMYDDIVEYAARLGPTAPDGNRGISARDRLTKLQRMLPRLNEILEQRDLDSLQQRGFVALVEDDCRCLSTMYLGRHLVPSAFTIAKAITDVLFPDTRRDPKQLAPYQLTFTNRFADRPIYCDYRAIRELSVRLYDDLVELIDHIKATLEDRTYAEATVYQQAQQFRAAIGLCKPQLSPVLLRSLQQLGLKAFCGPGFKLQKAIYAILQQAAKSGEVATLTAYGYKKCVGWWLDQAGLPVIEAFPVSQSKTNKHLQRLNTDDYYSAEQCRELAFHIESLLADPTIVGESRLALMLARVLLKTGWNLAPTLDIECDDIVRSTSPLNPHGPISVILQKRRAGYRADAYTFDEPYTNAASMRSALGDLLEVRDELTAGLRSSLPDSNSYKSFIFVYEKDGVVQRLSAAAIKIVSWLLARNGCDLTFDSKRIRKGGMNHLYRKVQKDMRTYEESAKHDAATFDSHYFRQDENQARYTLGQAVDVMGKYFSGKEVSKDIIIVTEVGQDSQETPPGVCSSKGRDQEARAYNLAHKKLHSERGAAAKFCADFLGCIWCKFFRLVADPDHVWRLLSYQDFVLQSIQSSVVGGPDSDQQVNVDILKHRVAEILKRLEAKAPGIVLKAETLLLTNGMHPDWSFALAEGPMS